MQALTEFRRLAHLLIVKDRPDHDVTWIVWQLRAIYREVPDLTLTAAEVQDTFGLDPRTCAVVFHALTDAGFLQPAADGFRLAA